MRHSFEGHEWTRVLRDGERTRAQRAYRAESIAIGALMLLAGLVLLVVAFGCAP